MKKNGYEYKLKSVCYGEILWDIFPNYKTLGGAPLNVALRLKSFGVNSSIISKIGNDKYGHELLNLINKDLDTKLIQLDNELETGKVIITLDNYKNAKYQIKSPSAWDSIELNDENIKAVQNADVFIYGSLSCRNNISKKTLLRLLDYAKFPVCDINLRHPHYERQLLIKLIEKAHLIKCNEEELFELSNIFNCTKRNLEDTISGLSKAAKTKKICVTRGERGAIFFDNTFYYNNGYKVKVVDTVGAGDSFLAAMLFKLLKGFDSQKALDYACYIGGLTSKFKGANPKLDMLLNMRL